MARGHLALSLLPTTFLVILAVALLAVAWKMNQGIDERRPKFEAVHQNARSIDSKAGISAESQTSATAMARVLKATDDAEAGYAQIMQGAGVLILILAAFQAAVIWRLRHGSEPSNTTPHADARDVPAPVSGSGARAAGRERYAASGDI